MSTSDLLAPYHHVASLRSKNLRDSFIDAANRVIGAPQEHVSAVKNIICRLHNASLLIDDIEDSAVRRRGQPSAHLIFGIPLTMNAANMVIFDVLGQCIALDRELVRKPMRQQHAESSKDVDPLYAAPSAMSIFHEELSLLHHGQGQDIFWRDTNRCPTEAEYRVMVENKTGGLFRLALRLLLLDSAVNASVASKLITAANHMSFAFQVLDDLLNLCSSDYHEKKTFCEDLSEGKFSFLTTHSIQASAPSGDMRLLRLLQSRPQEVDVKSFCLKLMEETGTFAYTRCTLERLLAEAHELLNCLVPEASDDSDGGDIASGTTTSASKQELYSHVTAETVEPLHGFVNRLALAVPCPRKALGSD